MKRLYTEEQIENMRKRLYDRGAGVEKITRHELSDVKLDVNRDWAGNRNVQSNTTDFRSDLINDDSVMENIESEDVIIEEKPKRRYRSVIMLGSLLIFVIVAALSSLFIYFGGNNISGDNIEIKVSGQPLIGGGEVMNLAVAVTNHNKIPIDDAVLIIKYPAGTRAADESARRLYEERTPLNNLEVGQTIDVPIKAVVYGEENNEQSILVSIEYRVSGSGGVFYKEANPLSYRISSAPLTLRVKSVDKVASGQLVDVVLSVASNASTPLQDVLVSASYPSGFNYQSAEPAPIYGQNVWQIKELLPEQVVDIKLKGVITGLTSEKLHINFESGPANIDNQFMVDAVLDKVSADFTIERPFIDVQIAINGDKSGDAVISEAQSSTVAVTVKNTLDETVYDMAVEVIPSGNALDINAIERGNGFYDSNAGNIRWEVSNNSNFAQVIPGDSRTLNFVVKPNAVRTTASYDVTVNVYARRVADSSASETLIGSTQAKARFSSNIVLNSQVGRNTSRFTDTGPIPPTVGETTFYTLTLVAEAGANNINNAIVQTSLPIHVNWLDEYEADGSVIYNAVAKTLEWRIGNITNKERKELNFQVSIQPSVSQVGQTLTLLNGQTMKAVDAFTNTDLQVSTRAVTTQLSSEMGFDFRSGQVINR